MPAYDYRCEKCGKVEEFIHAMDDVPEEHKCSKCGKKMKRVFGYAAPIHYSSDFKTENKNKQSAVHKKYY